ncbi:hypothetical protein X773_25035 [Mesorhizobium sp. LSJC285A00]|nr:hypothetical protein X771_25710 [Mesorhizobium sp. LSJC277A00]ESW76828.1 hypothetical protein X773_25035 [Mesorhizobium sp. LSJC285A00]ESZ56350.1 hypothetical protein X728_26815 [Mesorhizobium sp. L103C120A0]
MHVILDLAPSNLGWRHVRRDIVGTRENAPT